VSSSPSYTAGRRAAESGILTGPVVPTNRHVTFLFFRGFFFIVEHHDDQAGEVMCGGEEMWRCGDAQGGAQRPLARAPPCLYLVPAPAVARWRRVVT
jgi:hypothetical protein